MDKIDIRYKEEKWSYYSLLGLIIYCFCYLLGCLMDENAPVLFRVFQVIGILLFFYYLAKSGSVNHISNRYFKCMFFLLMVWHVSVIFRNYSLDSNYIKGYLREPYYFLHFFVPLVSLFPIKSIINKFSEWSLKLFRLFFLVFIIFWYPIFNNQAFSEQFVWLFGTCAGFILLNSHYMTRKNVTLSLLIVFTCLFIATVMARRNIMLTITEYIVASFILYIMMESSLSTAKKYFLTIIIIFSILGVYSFFINNQDDVFAKITDRVTVNSREELFVWFWADMSESDWLIGKGMNGTYFATAIDTASPFAGEDEELRHLVECGYLQIILKGGLVNVFLIVLIAIPAFFLGIFFSKNILSKVAGMLVLLWLIDMFPWGMPAFNIGYFLFWISIALCFNKEIREYSDEEILDNVFLLEKE